MKKTFYRLLTALLVCLLTCPLLLQQAEAADASLSGSSSLRAGNNVTVTFSLSGSGLLAIDADLSYDSDSLELMGSKQLIGSSWDMQQNGTKFILYDTKQTSPLDSSQKVFSVTFRVKSGVDIGETVSASISGTASDGTSESSFSASWSAKIKAPLSSDAKLKDLRCGNATLNFTGATEYRITVPYSVSTLDLDWDRSHSGAEVSVSGNKLSVGSNTVTITVTAENGAIKRYYIYATRQQDPSYVPSTDARLKSLTVSVGTLSPAFDPDITEYVVYLANETDRLELTAAAKDSKAENVRQVGSSNLPDGTTVLLMRCTAEDGITMLDYKIHVVRMPAFTGTLPEIIAPEEQAEPTVPAAPEPEPLLELPLLLTLPYVGEVEIWWVAGAALALLLLLVWLLAWAIGRRGGRKKALRQLSAQPAPTAEEPPAQEDSPTEAASAAAEESPKAATTTGNTPPDTTPAEEPPAQEEVPATEEPPAQEDASTADSPAGEPSTEEDLLFVEERPFTREETPPAPSAPASHRSSEPLEELGGMSLDDLLEDIRNM